MEFINTSINTSNSFNNDGIPEFTIPDQDLTGDFPNIGGENEGENGGGSGGEAEPVVLNVSTFIDSNDGGFNNGLSLRDAILRAKADPANEYLIMLGAGVYQLSIQGNEDSLFADDPLLPGDVDDIVARTGDLDIETRVRIVGVNPEETVINGANLGDRIFDVREGGFLTLENLTIEEGFANSPEAEGSSGGGIRIDANGSAIIKNSIIQNNETSIEGTDNNNGGGIANFGYTEIINSIVSGNLSGDDAGGIYNTGTLKIQYSAIVGNFANAAAIQDIEAGGGGIYNTSGGTLEISNSTVSGNITADAGGGILNENANAIIKNVTITNNTSQIGSGITVLGLDNPLLLQNSIVAGNSGAADIEGDFADNSSFNVIGDGNGLIPDGINNNQVGDVVSPLDPQLAPLASNGGNTPTHALLSNSPAINSGNNEIASEVSSTDQRGFERIFNGTVDIGSYEYTGAVNQLSTPPENPHPILSTPLFRLQNTAQPGTYVFVNEQERQDILTNYGQFVDEGYAFSVAVEPNDDLMAIYRMQNQDLLGTYLFVTEGEKNQILSQDDKFINEGLAFYVYGAGANLADSIYRFQNSSVNGTYLFVSEGERNMILQNHPNFIEEGIAWEASM